MTACLSPALLGKWLKGDGEAAALVLAIHGIVEIWDDLIDRDKPISAESVNQAFYAALIAVPRNRFYQQHFTALSPIIESAILDWNTATALEAARDAEGLRTAFVLRCSGLALTVMCARIVGGVAWARQVNLELRQMGDTWAEYSSGFGVM